MKRLSGLSRLSERARDKMSKIKQARQKDYERINPSKRVFSGR